MMFKHSHAHTKMFAPIFVCLAFGAAIVGVFAYMMPSKISTVKVMSYDSCMSLKDSLVLEMYPPVCVTKEGKRYTKNLPKIKMMERTTYPVAPTNPAWNRPD